MNRQDAIQDQINQNIDWFDWRMVEDMVAFLSESGKGCPEHWIDGDIVRIGAIRSDARKLLLAVANSGEGYQEQAHSYLFAQKQEEAESEEGPPFIWLQLRFVIVDLVFRDGTCYDKEAQQ